MYRYYQAQAFSGRYGSEHNGLFPVGCGSVGTTANYEVHPRILRDFHFVYVINGSGILRMMGKAFTIQKHDLFLLYPDVVHAYATDPEDLLEMYWIGFNGADADQMVQTVKFLPDDPVFSTDSCPEAGRAVMRMVQDSVDNRPSNFWALCGDLYCLFAVLLKGRTEDAHCSQTEQQVSGIVNEAQNFINIHYPQAISVSDVADHVGVSRATLAKRFQRELGMTPSEYLSYIRLRQAESYLKNTSLSVTEVAHSVGYWDALYFSRVFSRYYGVSPVRYRRNKRS